MCLDIPEPSPDPDSKAITCNTFRKQELDSTARMVFAGPDAPDVLSASDSICARAYLRSLRLHYHITQQQLESAGHAGHLFGRYIRDYEAGRHEGMRRDIAVRVYNGLKKLHVPFRIRNTWLLMAGFAPAGSEQQSIIEQAESVVLRRAIRELYAASFANHARYQEMLEAVTRILRGGLRDDPG